MAEVVGISVSLVQRIWHSRGLWTVPVRRDRVEARTGGGADVDNDDGAHRSDSHSIKHTGIPK